MATRGTGGACMHRCAMVLWREREFRRGPGRLPVLKVPIRSFAAPSPAPRTPRGRPWLPQSRRRKRASLRGEKAANGRSDQGIPLWEIHLAAPGPQLLRRSGRSHVWR